MNVDHVIPWPPAAPLRCGWLRWETPCLLHVMYYTPTSIHLFAHTHRVQWCVYQYTMGHMLVHAGKNRNACYIPECWAAQLQTRILSRSVSDSSSKDFFGDCNRMSRGRVDSMAPCWNINLVGGRSEKNRRELAFGFGWWLVMICWSPFLFQYFSKNADPDSCHSQPFSQSLLETYKIYW